MRFSTPVDELFAAFSSLFFFCFISSAVGDWVSVNPTNKSRLRSSCSGLLLLLLFSNNSNTATLSFHQSRHTRHYRVSALRAIFIFDYRFFAYVVCLVLFVCLFVCFPFLISYSLVRLAHVLRTRLAFMASASFLIESTRLIPFIVSFVFSLSTLVVGTQSVFMCRCGIVPLLFVFFWCLSAFFSFFLFCFCCCFSLRPKSIRGIHGKGLTRYPPSEDGKKERRKEGRKERNDGTTTKRSSEDLTFPIDERPPTETHHLPFCRSSFELADPSFIDERHLLIGFDPTFQSMEIPFFHRTPRFFDAIARWRKVGKKEKNEKKKRRSNHGRRHWMAEKNNSVKLGKTR